MTKKCKCGAGLAGKSTRCKACNAAYAGKVRSKPCRLEGARIWNAWTAIIALLITEQAMDDCEPYRWREYLALQNKPSASDAIKRAWGSSKQDK
jgi:hypothetical protein